MIGTASPSLLTALSKTSDPSHPTTGFALLPALENLEFISSRVPPLSLIELIEARRRVHGRSLKCIKLSECTSGVDDTWDEDDGEAVRSIEGWEEAFSSDYTSDEGLGDLPEEWKDLKVPLEEGLQFVVENDLV